MRKQLYKIGLRSGLSTLVSQTVGRQAPSHPSMTCPASLNVAVACGGGGSKKRELPPGVKITTLVQGRVESTSTRVEVNLRVDERWTRD